MYKYMNNNILGNYKKKNYKIKTLKMSKTITKPKVAE